jgi:hypothetical protein
MRKYYVMAMHMMANATDGFTRPVRDEDDRGGDFMWFTELASGEVWPDHTPCPDYLIYVRQLFEAWEAPEDEAGNALRAKAQAIYRTIDLPEPDAPLCV